METNFIRLMAQAREAKRQLQQEENVTEYFQVLYQNIFKSGMRFPQVTQFMDQVSKNANLQNKILISRVTTDLGLNDDQGRIIIVKDDSKRREDWLFETGFRQVDVPGEEKYRLSIKLNSCFPAPKVNDGDLTRYEERDVYKAAENLAHCGDYLNKYNDQLMIRAEFKQSTGQV